MADLYQSKSEIVDATRVNAKLIRAVVAYEKNINLIDTQLESLIKRATQIIRNRRVQLDKAPELSQKSVDEYNKILESIRDLSKEDPSVTEALLASNKPFYNKMVDISDNGIKAEDVRKAADAILVADGRKDVEK